MKMRELLLFARTDCGGALSPAAARALKLPMPEDVLEQFVLDHALDPEFQRRYGDLDLYSLVWSREQLERDHVVRCTSKFPQCVREVAERHAGGATLEQAVFDEKARRSWRELGTWLRPPLFFCGVLPPPDEHHLVEGHTRVGTLIGLCDNPASSVSVASTHECWVARPGGHQGEIDWRAVRREYPLSFLRWIDDTKDPKYGLRDLVCAVVVARSRGRVAASIGDDLEGLLRFVEREAILGVSAETLNELHLQWRREIGL